MILYNVTVNIDNDVHEDWLNWMKAVHIPEVLATQKFSSYKICKIISRPEEGNTYAIQYFCNSLEEYNEYQEKYAPNLQRAVISRYSDKFVAIRTLMEVIE